VATGVQFKTTSFAFNTSGTTPFTRDITIAGIGTPKAAIFKIGGGITAGTNVATAREGWGITDGTTSRAFSCFSQNNQATSNTGGRIDTTTVIYFNTVAGAVGAEASFNSWITDGVRINIDTVAAAAFIVEVTFVYGDDVSCSVKELTGSGSVNGTASVTGLSFAPTMVMAWSSINAFAADTAFNTSQISLGVSTLTAGSILQGCYALHDRDNVALSSHAGGAGRTNRIAQAIAVSAVGAATDNGSLELTAFNSDGATFTTRDVATAIPTMQLLIGTGTVPVWCGWLDIGTTSTGNKARTDPGWRPKFLGAIGSSLEATDTIGGGTLVSGHYSDGSGDLTATQAFTYQTEDNFTPTDTRSVTSSDLIRVLDNAGGIFWSATLVSFDTRGFTVNVTSAAGTAKYSFYYAIGGVPLLGNDTEQITDTPILIQHKRLVISETEQISDAVVLKVNRITDSDTETITDSPVLIQNLFLVVNEDEHIDDAAELDQSANANLVADETEDITDAFVALTPHAAVNETEDILDVAVLVVSKIVTTETEEISDVTQLVGAALAIATDTETITDQAILITGRVLTVDETETITDEVAFADRRTLAGWRGTVLQGGAVAGAVLMAGSARGTTL